MNLDSFLSSPRWEILKILSKSPSSPTKIAEILNVTIAYVSQQLKLLDAAGFISKTKTRASEKGKPRSLFRINEDIIYLIALTKNFSGKKLVRATDYHRNILKIWLIPDSSLHYYFEKLYLKIEEDKSDIEYLFLDISSPKFVVVSESKSLKVKIENYLLKFDRKITCSFVSKNKLKNNDTLLSLYDSTESGIKRGFNHE